VDGRRVRHPHCGDYLRGNFYTNIVPRDADSDAVAVTVGRMNRRAHVAGASTATIVFDEACDRQDLEEFERLARKLSGPHGPALAICNHDDDALWYALAIDGRIIDRYNSFPSYFDEGGDVPAGGDAERLCAAFGATKRADNVGALLRRQHADVGLEVDRHLELCRLLDLPRESVGMGYGYVESGEFAGEPGKLKAIGEASEAGEADGAGQAAAQTRATAPLAVVAAAAAFAAGCSDATATAPPRASPHLYQKRQGRAEAAVPSRRHADTQDRDRPHSIRCDAARA
jgi:hypothetical protein